MGDQKLQAWGTEMLQRMPWGSYWMTQWWNHHRTGHWAGQAQSGAVDFSLGPGASRLSMGGLPGLERYMGLKFRRSGSETEVWGRQLGREDGRWVLICPGGGIRGGGGVGAWGQALGSAST